MPEPAMAHGLDQHQAYPDETIDAVAFAMAIPDVDRPARSL